MTEEAMVQGCIRRDPVCQQELYRRFSPAMLSVCYRYAKHREDAEDMLQEGFIKVFTQIGQFQHKGALEGWIRKIMVHTCINILKKNRKFIRMLPLGYRTVLNLFAIEGYSHREIGQMLEIEESTSRSQYTRAKTMLEQILIKRQLLPVKQPADGTARP
jgi:RNA polymerase sigma-70 factor (ECF subfamily)